MEQDRIEAAMAEAIVRTQDTLGPGSTLEDRILLMNLKQRDLALSHKRFHTMRADAKKLSKNRTKAKAARKARKR